MVDEAQTEKATAADAAERPRIDGVPTVSAEEARQMDELAVEAGLTIDGMINRAAHLSSRIVLEELLQPMVGKPIEEVTVTALVGTGNKAAAALATAKRLLDAGATVNVVLARKTKEYEGEARTHLSQVERGAKKVYQGYNERAFDQADLILDGLIGAGLDGKPRASVSLLIKGANFSMKPIVSLDIPSGLNGTTGIQSPVTIKASATLVVGLPKTGMRGTNLTLCGEVYVLDLDIPGDLWEKQLGCAVGDVFAGNDWRRLDTEA